jgi:MinD-like ATPase involved in chromosome partitioning or flagellar assembly
VPESLNAGIPAVALQTRSGFARGIKEIAAALVAGEVARRTRDRRFRLLPGAGR